jgi:WD40-like Beta Propeller Repeat
MENGRRDSENFRRRGRYLSSALLLVVSLAGVGPASADVGTGGPRPQTLLTVSGSIAGFAQDGDHVVWGNGDAPCGRIVQLRTLSTGASRFLEALRGPMCEIAQDLGGMRREMALAGTRALWAWVSVSNTAYGFYLFTAAPGDRAERLVDDWEIEGGLVDPDAFLPSVGMAGDGTTLVYAAHDRLYRVVGKRVRPVAGTEGAGSFAVAGSRLALARWIDGGCACNGSPAWSADGRRIAFISGRARSLRGRMRRQLFVMNPDGTDVRLSMDDVSQFACAPNGAAIAVQKSAGFRRR